MINFSSALLGKDLTELTYQDIVHFFVEEKEETNTIEFKGFVEGHGNNFTTNIKGVIRAVCALLNSDGGIVIWGAPAGVPVPGTGKKKFMGALSPVPELKDKDWMINKISDNISALPVGIRVQVLQNSPTEVVYIVEVQPSPYKPHQTDNTYWARLDGQTKPAPHYLVEALFRRISYPNIEAYIKFNSVEVHNQHSLTNTVNVINFSVYLFNFSKLQNEENVFYRLVVLPGGLQDMMNTSSKLSAFHKQDVGMLHFGAPIENSHNLLITPAELAANKFQVKLILTFAGKTSPVKSCEYVIDLQYFDARNPTDTSKLIASKNENILLADKQDQTGNTRESVLEMILGRIP